jgi:hypothetical protein
MTSALSTSGWRSPTWRREKRVCDVGLPELEAELPAFPQGKTDDQVDSISQALSHKRGYDSTMSWVSG